MADRTAYYALINDHRQITSSWQ